MKNVTGVPVTNELEVDDMIKNLMHDKKTRDESFIYAESVISSGELFSYFVKKYKKETDNV